MKTSIDFLLNELLQNKLLALRYDKDNLMNEIVAKAEEIHMQEIMDAWNEKAYDDGNAFVIDNKSAEQYYKEKFEK